MDGWREEKSEIFERRERGQNNHYHHHEEEGVVVGLTLRLVLGGG